MRNTIIYWVNYDPASIGRVTLLDGQDLMIDPYRRYINEVGSVLAAILAAVSLPGTA